MSGNREGGKAAAITNKVKYGADYYARIGAQGGKKSTDKPKGFAHAVANGLDWHKKAGAKGGKTSRRVKKNG